jgi:hypothetical protein
MPDSIWDDLRKQIDKQIYRFAYQKRVAVD